MRKMGDVICKNVEAFEKYISDRNLTRQEHGNSDHDWKGRLSCDLCNDEIKMGDYYWQWGEWNTFCSLSCISTWDLSPQARKSR